MGYQHKTSLDWLQARQSHLTATDIIKLWPETPTGKKRDVDYLEVVASKYTELYEKDTWSYGAAARGHLLEPYALKGMEAYYHWDDTVISGTDRHLGFSPDGLTVSQSEEYKLPIVNIQELPYGLRLAEIKCFSLEKHYALARTLESGGNPDALKQVSVALSFDKIVGADIILFAPQNQIKDNRKFVFPINRSNVMRNIEIIAEIEEKWDQVILNFMKTIHRYSNDFSWETDWTEQKIITELEEEGMNP